jgi:hypothetical protein
MSKNAVMGLLSDRPVAYHPDVARICGGVKAGVFLSQLLYWSDRGKRNDGYIWKTQEEWEQETALTRREQETARRELKQRGLIDEKLQGVPAKLYYKINTDKLYELLSEYYVQTSMAESAILDCTEAPNWDAQKRQTITESTTETTKDYSSRSGAAVAAYEQTFGPIANRVQSDMLEDDIETYGETAVIEAIKAADEAGARTYKWASARLKGRATDGTKKAAASSIWDNEIEPYMHHKKKWPDVSPKAQQIIKSIGGQSRLRETKVGFEMDQLKREVMAHV